MSRAGAAGMLRSMLAVSGLVTLAAALPATVAATTARVAVPVNLAPVDKVEDGTGDEALLGAVASIITTKLGLPLPSPLYAHFYDSAEAFEEGLVRDARSDPATAKERVRFAVGVGSGRGIFLRRDRLTITTFNGRTAIYAHELAHVAQVTLGGGRRIASEQWLREGHADWVKYQVLDQLRLQPYARSRAGIIREVRFGAVATLPPLTTLSSPREWINATNRLGARETYVQAFLAADWLLERSGEGAMRDYFRGDRIRDQVTAFESVFGVSPTAFSEQFADYLATLVLRGQ